MKILYDRKFFESGDFKEFDRLGISIKKYYQKSAGEWVPVIILIGAWIGKPMLNKMGEKMGEVIGEDCVKVYGLLKKKLKELLKKTPNNRLLVNFHLEENSVKFKIGVDVSSNTKIGKILCGIEDFKSNLKNKIFETSAGIKECGATLVDGEIKEIYFITLSDKLFFAK